ncbi:MAG: DUF4143 domain-containing protein [Candidatus Nanopelagicales bacterium]
MEYQPRVIDAEVANRLESAGAIVLEGPKGCGKTETARRVAASEVLLDTDTAARALADVDPTLLLEGSTPRLLDEWQIVPPVWNAVRREVDKRGLPGQFVLTGSATPTDDISRHTGAGRFSRLRMRPMSLFESGNSTGSVSMADVLAGARVAARESTNDIRATLGFIARGGWPLGQALNLRAAMTANRDYLDQIRRTDLTAADGVRRDPQRLGRLFQSLARNVATAASITTIATDVGEADSPLDRDTAREYLAALERLMVVEDQPAWQPHLRSKYRLRLGAKRHFVDPCLAVAALRSSPEQLVKDLQFAGMLFESMVIRDLRTYSQPLDGTVYYYLDNAGLEVDAVVDDGAGSWAAFEVKLGTSQIDTAAASLLKFRDRIDTTKSGQPRALVVIVPNGYGYLRPDGVSVVPITALGP